MKRTTSLLAALGLVINTASAGDPTNGSPLMDYPSPPSDSPWEFEVSPYGWLANLKGTVAVGGAASSVSVGFDDILDNLDFVFATTAGVRYNRIGLYADFLYLDVSPSTGTPGSLYKRVDLRLQQTMFDPKISFRVVESERGWLDVLAGARYMDLDLGVALVPGSAPALSGAGSESWWDIVGGLRGRYQISDRLFLTGLADIGGGDSDITWQVQAALGYQLSDLVDLTLGYRYLDYEYKNGDFAYDLATRGVVLGLGFSW